MSGFEFLCPSTLYCCHYNYVRKLKRCMCVCALVFLNINTIYIYIYLTVQTLWHTLIFVECWMVWVKWCGTWTAAGLLFVIWPKDWTSQISGWNQTHQALNDHPQSIPTFPTVVLDGIGYAPISGNGRMGWYEMSPKSGMVYDLVYRFTTVWYFNVASRLLLTNLVWQPWPNLLSYWCPLALWFTMIQEKYLGVLDSAYMHI